MGMKGFDKLLQHELKNFGDRTVYSIPDFHKLLKSKGFMMMNP